MSTATITRSAYPPAIEDLMPKAIELTKTLGGALPSRNRLKKELHIGPDKANAILAELATLAEQDQFATDRAVARIRRGHPGFPPPLTLVPEPADDQPDTNTDADPGSAAVGDDTAMVPPAPATVEVSAPVVDVPEQPQALRSPVTWPVLVLCLPAFIAIWGGWVEMGRLTGFGKVTLLPGIADAFQLNTAITLPIGVETYAAYALYAWLSGRARGDARTFAKHSALASLGLGGLGQIAYHLMNAAGWTAAPWPITAVVACIPVAVLGMGAALAHLMHKH